MKAFWLEALRSPMPLPRAVRRALVALVCVSALAFTTLALLRFRTFHNVTFDLAFYARMAWGEVHLDNWNPIVDAHARGLHLSWILLPLGLVGAVFGQVPTLLVAQASALALAALPLARMGARHLGPAGALVVGAAWLLHPNIGHVATNEFHPGSVAALPLALAVDALDRRSRAGLVVGCLGVLACREDLGLVTMLIGLAAAWIPAHGVDAHALRRTGLGIAAGSLLYVAVFALVLHPLYAPAVGSLELHFGRLGSSVPEVVLNVFRHPGTLLEHLGARHRLAYVPLVCAPFALLPLLRPGYALLAAPVLAINLISEFPGTTALDSHYLTTALPMVLAAAIHGAAALPRSPLLRLGPLGLCAAMSHVAMGGTPLSVTFDAASYVEDENTVAARRMVARIPARASVQAPDALLPHLAERRTVRRAPPPETRADFVVMDLSHRRRFRHDEDLLRTTEEPLARVWLSRRDHALVDAGGDYVLLERGRDPRTGIGVERYVVDHADRPEGQRLAACLRLQGATLERRPSGADLVLQLVATEPCPDDLALRVGRGKRPARVDLIADGLLSPALLEAGDVVRSVHSLSEAEAADPSALRVGALRSSGARPDHDDPLSVSLGL